MKWILVAVLLSLMFGGGASRLRALLGAAKNAKRDFEGGKSRADDPAGHAKDVTRR